MVETIRNKLNEFIDMHPEYEFQKVFYGRAYDPNEEMLYWNYIVLSRVTTGIKSTRVNNNFAVVVVHEDYIPEGCVLKIVEHLEKSIPGFRIADDAADYDYTFKGNTQLVVEGIGLEFSLADRRDC